MRILHETFAPNTKLPFEIIKGNTSHRTRLSKEYFAKFYDKMKEITKNKNTCPLNQTQVILKEVLAPYNIPFEFLKILEYTTVNIR